MERLGGSWGRLNVWGFLDDPQTMTRLHGVLAIVWLALAILTTVWGVLLGESPFLLWVVFMSGYANSAAHMAARQGAAPSAEEAS